MTRKTQKFLLTLGAVTAGFLVVLFLGALASGDLTPSTEQTAPLIHEFNPIRKEFKLDNGTPCVMVWAPQRAQSAGISCDWNYNRRKDVN